MTAPRQLPPGAMPTRIVDWCARSGHALPVARAAILRCILDGLAGAFARTVDAASSVAGWDVSVVHLVGGGARNPILCQLTADACGRPVVAGPVEATAIGNVLLARAVGLLAGGLAELRALVRETQPVRRFEPRGRPVTQSARP